MSVVMVSQPTGTMHVASMGRPAQPGIRASGLLTFSTDAAGSHGSGGPAQMLLALPAAGLTCSLHRVAGAQRPQQHAAQLRASGLSPSLRMNRYDQIGSLCDALLYLCGAFVRRLVCRTVCCPASSRHNSFPGAADVPQHASGGRCSWRSLLRQPAPAASTTTTRSGW